MCLKNVRLELLAGCRSGGSGACVPRWLCTLGACVRQHVTVAAVCTRVRDWLFLKSIFNHLLHPSKTYPSCICSTDCLGTGTHPLPCEPAHTASNMHLSSRRSLSRGQHFGQAGSTRRPAAVLMAPSRQTKMLAWRQQQDKEDMYE
jgi:hypothetical protein